MRHLHAVAVCLLAASAVTIYRLSDIQATHTSPAAAAATTSSSRSKTASTSTAAAAAAATTTKLHNAADPPSPAASPPPPPPIPLRKAFGRLVLLADSIGMNSSEQAAGGVVNYLDVAAEVLARRGYAGELRRHVRPGLALVDWYRTGLLDLVRAEAAAGVATAYVVQLGVNDVGVQLSPALFLSLMWEVLAGVRAAAPEATVAVMTVNPCPRFGPDMVGPWLQEVNVGLSEVCAAFRCLLVPAGEALLDAHLRHSGGREEVYFQDPNCHPNGVGRRLLGEHLGEALAASGEAAAAAHAYATSARCGVVAWCGFVVAPQWPHGERCGENPRLHVALDAAGGVALRAEQTGGNGTAVASMAVLVADRRRGDAADAAVFATLNVSVGGAAVAYRAGAAQGRVREPSVPSILPVRPPQARPPRPETNQSGDDAAWKILPMKRTLRPPAFLEPVGQRGRNRSSGGSSGRRVVFVSDGEGLVAPAEEEDSGGVGPARGVFADVARHLGGLPAVQLVLHRRGTAAFLAAEEVVAAVAGGEGTPPGAVVVSVGTADLRRGMSLGAFAARYRALVRRLREAVGPAVPVALVAFPPEVPDAWQATVVLQEVAVTHRCAVAEHPGAEAALLARAVADALEGQGWAGYPLTLPCAAEGVAFAGYVVQLDEGDTAAAAAAGNATCVVRMFFEVNGSAILFKPPLPHGVLLTPSWFHAFVRVPIFGQYLYTMTGAAFDKPVIYEGLHTKSAGAIPVRVRRGTEKLETTRLRRYKTWADHQGLNLEVLGISPSRAKKGGKIKIRSSKARRKPQHQAPDVIGLGFERRLPKPDP